MHWVWFCLWIQGSRRGCRIFPINLEKLLRQKTKSPAKAPEDIKVCSVDVYMYILISLRGVPRSLQAGLATSPLAALHMC